MVLRLVQRLPLTCWPVLVWTPVTTHKRALGGDPERFGWAGGVVGHFWQSLGQCDWRDGSKLVRCISGLIYDKKVTGVSN